MSIYNSLKTRFLSKGKFKPSPSFKIVYKLILNHPFIVVMLIFLIYFQLHFPFLFSVLLSASPVILCTVLLLATLLIHGQPNPHPRKSIDSINHTCKIDTYTSNVTKEGYFNDRFAEVRKDIVEKGMKTTYFGDFGSNNNNNNNNDDHGSTSDETDGLVTEAIESSPQETRPLLDCQTVTENNVSPTSSDDGDDDEEEEGEEGNGTMWTEEDEKNLKYLGTCELERNQYLENLIARRKNQRNFSSISHRNMKDMGSKHSGLIPNFQVNPFDVVPNNPDSTLTVIPRKNPFDSPCTSPKEKVINPFDVHNGSSTNQEFAPKEFALRRYESFNPTGPYGYIADESSGSGSGSGYGQDFMHIDKREGMLLPRHESFTARSTMPNLFSLDKPTNDFQIKPVFAPEQVQQQSTTSLPDGSISSTTSGSSDTESLVAHTNPLHNTQEKIEEKESIREANSSLSSSSVSPKGEEKHEDSSKVEGHNEVRERNVSPKNSVDESSINYTSNDGDHKSHIEPVYDTSPQG